MRRKASNSTGVTSSRKCFDKSLIIFVLSPIHPHQERCFALAGPPATRWAVAGRPGVPGPSATETAAGGSEAGRGLAVTRNLSTEVRPAWDKHRSIRSVTSLLVQVTNAHVYTLQASLTYTVHNHQTEDTEMRTFTKPEVIHTLFVTRTLINTFYCTILKLCCSIING